MKLLLKAFFYFSLFFVSACATNPLVCSWKTGEVKNQNVILFVPGLYGSALAEASTGDRFFLNFTRALWGRRPLAMAGEKLGFEDSVDLRSDGLMEQLSVIPGLYTIDFYGGTFRYLQKTYADRARVIPFPYDWRQNDFQTVHELAEQVKALKSAGAKSITLIGHSLGATVIAFYLRYGDPKTEVRETWEGARMVDRAVVASPIFRGAMKAFWDFQTGVSLGFSSVPLSASALGSMPSYYQFLPPSELGSFKDAEFRNVHQEIYRAENWEHWKSGLFQETTATQFHEPRKTYTANCLKEAVRFSSLLRAESKMKNPHPIPVLVGIGTGVPTPSKAVWTGKNSLKEKTGKWVFEEEEFKELFPHSSESLFEDGDGLVTVSSAEPPLAYMENLQLNKILLPMPHRGMFTRSDFQEKVDQFLNNHL